MPFVEIHAPRLTRSKQRTCLCCAKGFDSGWAGERICPHCKASAIWREDLTGHGVNQARYLGKVRRKAAS